MPVLMSVSRRAKPLLGEGEGEMRNSVLMLEAFTPMQGSRLGHQIIYRDCTLKATSDS